MHACARFRFAALGLVALGLALGLPVPGPVAAAPNPPQAIDPPAVFDLAPDVTGCGFDVRITATGKFKFVALPGGRTIATAPGDVASVENLSTGKSVALNITGALHIAPGADGSTTFVATRRNLLWGGQENALVLTRGRFTWTFDAGGNVSPQAGTGNKTDVCALIA